MDPINKIGEKAPQFLLIDLEGNVYTLEDIEGRIIVLNFWSAECDYCARVDTELKAFMNSWKERVKVLWIASNANETRELIEEVANERAIAPVLLDEHQQAANRFGAQITPHFFVLDAKGIMVYQGSWDDISFRQRVATQMYVPQAVDALMQARALKISQTPPYGCMLVRHSDPDG
jgi:peroxiredoxin